MLVELKRIAKRDSYTIGHVYIDGTYFCDSVEDTDRGLADTMSVEEITKKKVYAKTAIPTGTYKVRLSYSNRFKKMMLEVMNVKGFSGIRIHSGNTAADTEGCLILGENKVVGKVINSRDTISKFMKKVGDCKDLTIVIS